MAGSHSLTGALAISLGLHAAVLVVPIRSGHHAIPAKRGTTELQVLLAHELVALPSVSTERVVAMVEQQPESRWAARATDSLVSPSPESSELPPGLIPLPEAPKPIYFTAGELHIRPSPIGTLLKEEAGRIYPDSSTHLLIRINEQGRVDHAEILRSTNETLAREALSAFSNARYVPGKIAGRKVKSELRVEVISSNDIGLRLRPVD